MKWRLSSIPGFLLVLAALLKPAPASAQLQYVGIPSGVFNFYAAAQQKDEWCWAASIQMIMNYYGVSITQDQIVARSFGIDPNTGDPPDLAGGFPIVTANLNNWSVDNSGQQYVVQAGFSYGAPNPIYLVRELSAQRPVLIAYMSSSSSMHAVVITGCSFIPTAAGPMIQSIIVRDPWPSDMNVQNDGRVEYPAAAFGNLMRAYWIIRVRR